MSILTWLDMRVSFTRFHWTVGCAAVLSVFLTGYAELYLMERNVPPDIHYAITSEDGTLVINVVEKRGITDDADDSCTMVVSPDSSTTATCVPPSLKGQPLAAKVVHTLALLLALFSFGGCLYFIGVHDGEHRAALDKR